MCLQESSALLAEVRDAETVKAVEDIAQLHGIEMSEGRLEEQKEGYWFNFVQFRQLRTAICCVLLLGHSYGYALVAIHNT